MTVPTFDPMPLAATMRWSMLFVSALIGSAANAQHKSPLFELHSYLLRFTGPGPSDCGTHLLVGREALPAGVEALQASLACAVEASKERRPFWTLKQDPAIDSWAARGLVGTADGTLYQYSYADGGACGAPRCPGRFSVRRCESPLLQRERGGALFFGCTITTQ